MIESLGQLAEDRAIELAAAALAYKIALREFGVHTSALPLEPAELQEVSWRWARRQLTPITAAPGVLHTPAESRFNWQVLRRQADRDTRFRRFARELEALDEEISHDH